MKKLILLALVAVMMVGCSLDGKDVTDIHSVCIIDSCEYVVVSGFSYPTHKGNCKYCAERRKKELQEIVEQLKDK